MRKFARDPVERTGKDGASVMGTPAMFGPLRRVVSRRGECKIPQGLWSVNGRPFEVPLLESIQ